MLANPDTDLAPPQPHSSVPPGDRAPSVHTAQSKSSRSSATVKAQKAAAEALALRRRLEREQELAAHEREREQVLAQRERERERHLAELQRLVEESELQAELQAIDADAESSRASHRSSTRVSVDRTKKWIENHDFDTCVNKDNPEVGCEQRFSVPSPGLAVPPPKATRVSAFPINSLNRQSEPGIATKASEAAGFRPPLIPTDLGQPVLLQAVADTAAAAKALASASSVKKLELPQFMGNTLQWLQFKRIYNVTKNNFSPLDNINRLHNALRGPARDAVAALLMSTEDPEEVMRALEDNFARPELIVYKEVNALKNLPRLGNNDLKELGILSNKVRNSISTIKLLNHLEYLYSPELFHAVLGKLNPTMKIRWTDFATLDGTGRPKLEILSDFLKREFDQHIRFGLSPEFSATQPQHNTEKIQKRESVHNINVQIVQSKSSIKGDRTKKQACVFCNNEHNIKDCSKFKSLSVDERWQWLREAKVCYRCLKASPHKWKACQVKPCGVDGCSFRHNALLHQQSPPAPLVNVLHDQATNNEIDNSINIENDTSLTSSYQPTDDKVIVSTTSTGTQKSNVKLALHPRAHLKIVPVTVAGPTGSCNVYAFLDDGSTASLIDSSIATRIGSTEPKETITVNGVCQLQCQTTISYVDFEIRGRYTKETFSVKNARCVDNVGLRTQSLKREALESFSHLTDVADVLTYEDATPTILIGAEHWYLSIPRDVRVGGINEPAAVLTVLGWVLYGVVSSKTKLVEFINYTHADIINDENLESLIKEQYKLDSIGITKTETLHSKQDQRAIDILEATTKRLPSGRFEVGMPWRDGIQRVPDSYPQAMSRFLSLERRMCKEVEFAKAYNAFINNMLAKGYAEECAPDTYYGQHNKNSDNMRLYLPHFGVYHPQKRKVRVVHDAAARNEVVSLNSLLLSGPDLLQPLLKVLFRFRESCVGITADIKEMFPQVRVRDQDRDALRFLWRPDKTIAIKEYRMTSVIFGACCSPFIGQFIKNKNALEHADSYPQAVDAILFSHYMDDYIDSQDGVNEAAQLAADIIAVHNAACFEMRGWISNEREALKLVPDDLRAAQSLEIDLGELTNSIRALGIAWNPALDTLVFRTGLIETIPTSLTKRKVLSHVMRVYDPLGLLGPIVVKGRILFQQTWRSNIDWDTELPQTEASKWFEWFQDHLKVSSLKIPRWYSKIRGSEPSYRELHVLADASELAYACVAYWRLVYPDGNVELTLIASKTRVSPLKPMSIPRLELQAALIASRIALVIKDSHRKKPRRTYFWTDSMTVLQWLRSDTRAFKPFVAHCLGEILENSDVKDWHWVPTDLNVADDATRLRLIDLTGSHRWFSGPSFLLKSPEDGPTEPLNVTPAREELKCQPNELVGLTSVNTVLPTPVTANLHTSSCPARPGTSSCGNFRFSQEFHYIVNSKPIPSNSRLIKLSPSLGEDNLIHLAGRIKAVEDIDPESRFPILLDGCHPVARLLVQYYHKRAGHANNEYVINELRQRFWLLRLRDTVRSIAHKCLLCKIRKSKPMNPATGDLPPQRLAHHQRAFTFTGLDYFGPVNVTVGRRHEKRYVALYTCLTTRALHLELVHSLSSHSAIMSLRRFIARRGVPNTIYSDNGTAFIGANRILRQFYSDDIQEEAATRGIKWSFIPAAAPSFGGCWERLVKTVKVALRATLNERFPKEETLVTLLMEAEAIANSRPLTHVSTDPEDPTSLTPFHFLIGSPSNQTLPSTLEDRDLFGRSEWKKAIRLSDHFWKRWVREVLPTMQTRLNAKGDRGQELQIGDVVIIVDESLPRGTWPKGRVNILVTWERWREQGGGCCDGWGYITPSPQKTY
ncbi:uncharacterized protein LOC134806710 [Cydia splendana]|uniref:uncharacterized protein LOC134806710 n=1 Tax=Cydia splendana TaxID=1100963 RepID=UPI00300D47EB